MQCHFANLPPEYISELREEQSARRFTITGILLDQGNAGMDFSLKPFTVLGFAGAFAKKGYAGTLAGISLVFVLRFVSHLFSGAILFGIPEKWADKFNNVWLYSEKSRRQRSGHTDSCKGGRPYTGQKLWRTGKQKLFKK